MQDDEQGAAEAAAAASLTAAGAEPGQSALSCEPSPPPCRLADRDRTNGSFII